MAMANSNPYAPQTPYYGQPWGYGAAPVMWNGAPNVTIASSLSDAEIQSLKENKPAFNLNISEDESTRAMCNHKSNNGVDPVHPVNDGTGDLICDICGARWNPEPVTKDEVKAATNVVINYLENSKYIGNLPTNVIREFYTIIPLMRKIPDLYEIAVDSYNRIAGNNAMWNSPEASTYQLYNSMMGGYNPNMYYQQVPPMNQPMNGYYQQPVMNQQPPVMTNPSVNPMQATYGVNNAAPNQQFNAQANAMMNGGAAYQQVPMGNPYQPAMMNNGVPQYAPMQQPVAQPQQTAPTEGSTVTTESKIEL